MINPQCSNDPSFLAYTASSLYSGSTAGPMNTSYHREYASDESSSSTLIRNQSAPSSQACLPSDLPDLFYDQNWPSPHSATSSNMVVTPPPEWQTPWQPTESQYISNNPPYMSSLGPRQVARPTVAPIDTNCNRKDDQHGVAGHPSVLSASHDDFGSMRQYLPQPSPYFQTSFDSNGITSFGHSPSTLSSSPLSTNTCPSALAEPLRTESPHPSQPPLKLHQPRPFRRIPIVSLSKLASACDDFPIPTHSNEPNSRNVTGTDLNFGAHSSLSSFVGATQPSSHRSKQHLYQVNNTYPSTLAGTPASKVIMCPCGCMESYTFRY